MSVWLGAWGGPRVCALEAHSLMLTASSLHARGRQTEYLPAGRWARRCQRWVWGVGSRARRGERREQLPPGSGAGRWEPERRCQWGAPRGPAGCPELGVLGQPAGHVALDRAGQVSFHPKLLCLLGKSRGEGLRPGAQVRSWVTTLSGGGWLLRQRRCWCRGGRFEGHGHPGLRRGSADPTLVTPSN